MPSWENSPGGGNSCLVGIGLDSILLERIRPWPEQAIQKHGPWKLSKTEQVIEILNMGQFSQTG
jgi:hypothetical protein